MILYEGGKEIRGGGLLGYLMPRAAIGTTHYRAVLRAGTMGRSGGPNTNTHRAGPVRGPIEYLGPN